MTTAEQRAFARKVECEEDGLYYARYFFKQRTGGKMIVAPHHKVIQQTLDRVIDGEIQRLIINVPPGYTKTELATINMMGRGLALNCRARFMHLSYSHNLALLNSSTARGMIKSQAYQSMWPMSLRDDADSKAMWWTEHGGGVYASSAAGQVTGFRAGHMEPGWQGALIIDDPVKPDGGAGSATGNPDDITSPNAEGYCSFAFGKNVIALGAKSAALCEETEANSRAAFSAGYFSQARAGFTSDPGGVASDGVGAIALGYRARAAGDGSFAAGKNIQAYGGAIAIGHGINDGNPAVNPSTQSVSIFSNSVVPGFTVSPGAGGLTDFSKVGIHSQYPKELVDIVLPTGQSAALRISSSGAGNSGKLLLQGTANDGSALTIATLEWTSVNGGSASGTLKVKMNGGAESLELSTDGMIALKNVKTLGEISGAPAGTVYKDGSNFLKIV